MATAPAKEPRVVKENAPLLLMQEIAEQLYTSTPGLSKEMPIVESKILGPQFLGKNGSMVNKPPPDLKKTAKITKK